MYGENIKNPEIPVIEALSIGTIGFKFWFENLGSIRAWAGIVWHLFLRIFKIDVSIIFFVHFSATV